MLLRRVLRSRDSRRSNKDEGKFPSPTTDYRRLGSVRSYESSISIARKERDAVGFINYSYAIFFLNYSCQFEKFTEEISYLRYASFHWYSCSSIIILFSNFSVTFFFWITNISEGTAKIILIFWPYPNSSNSNKRQKNYQNQCIC